MADRPALFFDLTDMLVFDEQASRMSESLRSLDEVSLVDNLQRSSPRVNAQLHSSSTQMSEAVYQAENRPARKAYKQIVKGPIKSEAPPLSSRSRLVSSDENRYRSNQLPKKEPRQTPKNELAKCKQSTVLAPQVIGRGPFDRKNMEISLPALKVMNCPDAWIPDHHCDDFCRSHLVNL